MFIDNMYKDLTEVRCKDTGVLLGFAPAGLCNGRPECRVAIKSKMSVADNFYSKTQLQETYTTPHVIFRANNLRYGLNNRIETVEISREDWEKLQESNNN